MTDIAVSSPVTDAVIAALETIPNPSGGSIRVGDAVDPARPKPTPKAFYPYAVVYSGATRFDGDAVHPKEDALHRIQVTSVSLDRRGAEWLRDQVRDVLLDLANWNIDGFVAVWTELVTSQPVARDNDETPPLFYAVDVCNVFVAPAASS